MSIVVRRVHVKRVKISLSIAEVEEENRQAPFDAKQCSSWFGSGGIVFCLRREGHGGDHRGLRAQWVDIEDRVDSAAPKEPNE